MIEQLECLRWQAMGHLCDILNDLPAVLQDLASPVETTREHARSRLEGEIYYRYGPYEVNFFVVPFLIELVTHQTWQDRDAIVRTLEEFIWGDSSDDTFPWTQETVVQWLTREYLRRFSPPQSLKEGVDNEEVLSFYRASDSFMPNISRPPLKRITAHWKGIEAVMLHHIFSQENPSLQVFFLLSLFRPYLYLDEVTKASSLQDELLLNHLVGVAEIHPLVKVVAALIHIRLQGVSADKAIVHTLLDILVQGDLIEEWNKDVPIPPYGSGNFVLHFAGWTLRFLAPQMGEFVLLSLLEIFQQRQQACRRHSLNAMSIELVHALLYFAFGETHLPQNALPFLLTKTQRSVLTLLLTSELIATDELAERFILFGLPFPWKARLLLELEAEPQTTILPREDDVLERLW